MEAAKEGDSEPIRFKYLTPSELDDADLKVEYLISSMLVAGQPGIMAGPKKCLKTSILVDIAVSLATNTPVLGFFETARPTKVALMSAESGLSTIRSTARTIAANRGLRLRDVTGLFFMNVVPKFGNALHLSALSQMLEETGAEVLAIDPAYLAMPAADAGNLMAQGELLSGVNEVCQKFGTTLLLAHHTKQTRPGGNPYAEPELDDIAWAGFAEWARQWILLNRQERYSEGSGLHRVWLSTGGSMGHSGLWSVTVDEGQFVEGQPRRWDVTIESGKEASEHRAARKEAAAEERKNATLEANKRKILDALIHYPDGETFSEIASSAGLSGQTAKPAIGSLKREGAVITVEIIKSGKKYEGFKRVYGPQN